MVKQTRKVYRKNRKNKKTRSLRKQKGGAPCKTEDCPEHIIKTEEKVNNKGKKTIVTTYGPHDLSVECKAYRGAQNCKVCSLCGKQCIYS